MKIKLQEQPFQILVLLLERPGEVVLREEVCRKLWAADTFVDFDNGLNIAVNKLRLALGDDAEAPRYVETLPRRGYRFIAPVEREPVTQEGPMEAPQPAAANVAVARKADSPKTVPKAKSSTSTAIAVMALLVIAAILLLMANVAGVRDRILRRGAGETVNSIAVLPWQNLSADPAQEYFADGMTEELITDLAKIGSLRVISRTSAMQYKGTHKSLAEISGELGVRYVLEGSVRKEQNRVRITAQLIDTSTGFHLWAQDFDRDLKDVFSVQEETALKIADALKVQLSPQEQQAVQRRYTQNVEAYDAFLRGKALVGEFDRPDKLELARKDFEEALRRDPNYAPALAGLAWVEGQYYRNIEWNPSHLHRAETLAQKALAIDPQLSVAHVALGLIAGCKYDYRRAAEEFHEARRLEPDNAPAWDYESWALAYQQPPDGVNAEKATREALRLGFFSLAAYYHLGRALLVQGRYDGAIAAFEQARAIDPTSGNPDFGIAQVYLARREYERALQVFLRIPEKLRKMPGPRFVASCIYAGLGEREKSLAELQTALDGGFRDFAAIDASPELATWRSDPRYLSLVHRVGLPE
jgi:TolB-like protein/DNA-binding winged helix-turn-helix (wHTH) protein/Tfp pilus assembly protein PilF